MYLPAQTWIRGLSLNDGATALALSLTSTYYRIRFGGYQPTRSQRLDLLHSVATFEQLLKEESS